MENETLTKEEIEEIVEKNSKYKINHDEKEDETEKEPEKEVKATKQNKKKEEN